MGIQKNTCKALQFLFIAMFLMGNFGTTRIVEACSLASETGHTPNSADCIPYSLDQEPAGENEPEDLFGSALAVGDFNGDGIDDLAVGAPGEDYNDSGPDAGVVFTFSGNADGLADPVFIHQEPVGDNETGDRFGSSLVAGDFNGDGIDDLAVGVPGEDYQDSGPDAGVVFVFSGSLDGLGDPYIIDQNPHGANESGDLFGTALAAGDFNGDGIDDLAAGIPGEDYQDSGPDAGVVFVFSGSPDGLGDAYFVHQEPVGGNETGDRFGSSLIAADFNADGIDDLAVGVPGEDYQDSGPNAGVVFVFSGSTGGLGETFIINQDPHGANESNDFFGTALAAGDFNGDGVDDLAISALEEAYEDFGANVGWIYIANGSLEGLGESYWIDQTPAGDNEAEDQFGASLTVGDFNGDGIADLAVGAPGEDYDGSGPGAGVAFIFPGSPEGAGDPHFIHQEPFGNNESGDHFASALTAGDFNGDGFDELAIGIPNETYEDIGANVGWVLVNCDNEQEESTSVVEGRQSLDTIRSLYEEDFEVEHPGWEVWTLDSFGGVSRSIGPKITVYINNSFHSLSRFLL